MATARDMITMCLKDLGVIAAGETPASSESSDALSVLNNMLDSWSADNLMIFNQVIETFALVSSQQTYTMGSGGDFSTTRPTKILRAGIQIQGTSPTAELPLRLLNLDEWARVLVKTVTSTIPTALYVNDGFPLTELNFWPLPSAAQNAVIYSLKSLTSISTLDTAISLPPGYWEAMQYNLDLRLAPQYGRTLRAELVQFAQTGIELIRRSNVKPLFLGMDEALVGPTRSFNWRTGE